MENLRFAPIIRVSTEKQKKQGESLLTQHTQIQSYVETLGGVIPEHCYQYSGQEHATPNYERAKLEQLLQDSGKDLFDAVIVCDTSRWSRDNAKSKAGLEILRNNNIRFFVATTEMNLNDPEHCLILGMTTEMNEFFAKIQAKKSLDSKIHKAHRGIPSIGKRPYARTYDEKNNKWILDEEKAEKIRYVCEEYLRGVPLIDLARQLGMSSVNLSRTIRKCSGDTWTVIFKGREAVTYQVPRILSDDMIQRVKDRLKFNKCENRFDIPNKYVLSGFVRCEACGSSLSGQTQIFPDYQRKYYIHDCRKKESDKCITAVRLEPLENAIFQTIFENFIDIPSFEKAIKDSMPDEKMVNGLVQKIKKQERELNKVQRELDKLVEIALAGTLTAETIKAKETELIESKESIIITLKVDRVRLQSLPDINSMKQDADKIRRKLLEKYGSKNRLKKMTYDEKRELLHWLFDGKDEKGLQYGIYISKQGSYKDQKIDYFIYGSMLQGLRTLKGDNINYIEDIDYMTKKISIS
jgi:DNA invertase Pin-like site-specific DNA recombinase